VPVCFLGLKIGWNPLLYCIPKDRTFVFRGLGMVRNSQ